jgi:hypothetical protein
MVPRLGMEEPEAAAGAGELRLRERRDGWLGLEGFLESEQGGVFRSLIEQFAAPRPAAEGILDARHFTLDEVEEVWVGFGCGPRPAGASGTDE